MHILPIVSLSDTEQTQVQVILSQPIIKKYLSMLATKTVSDICLGSPADSESDSLYIRKEAVLKGQLALIETLLSIQPIKPQE